MDGAEPHFQLRHPIPEHHPKIYPINKSTDDIDKGRHNQASHQNVVQALINLHIKIQILKYKHLNRYIELPRTINDHPPHTHHKPHQPHQNNLHDAHEAAETIARAATRFFTGKPRGMRDGVRTLRAAPR